MVLHPANVKVKKGGKSTIVEILYGFTPTNLRVYALFVSTIVEILYGFTPYFCYFAVYLIATGAMPSQFQVV